MKKEHMIVLGLGLALVGVAVAWEVVGGLPKPMRVEITKDTLQVGLSRPTIWIFLNDSDTNSRSWSDFMSRSSSAINIPILNLFYQTITKHNGDKYRIEVVGGLQHVAELMGGWDKLPTLMRNPKARINGPEEDWIRTALLAKYGGLWLSPSVVCLRPFGELPADKVVAFGQDTVPMYGSAVPGFRALWSPKAGHQFFVKWEARIRNRLEFQNGGRQVRGDAKSDWVDLTAAVSEGEVEVRVKEELGRDPRTNKSLDLEQIFAAGTQGRLPFSIPPVAVYIHVPYADLLDRRAFGWILKSSEEQIMESDLAIRHVLEASLNSGRGPM
jgi:hypothetical protein